MDDGRSRRYFDQKDPRQKRKFIERFANRRRDGFVFIGSPKDWEKLPFGFTAFLTDTGEKLLIEKIVGYRDV